MSISAEALQSQIPYYLTSEPEQKEFLSALTSLIGGASSGYFITSSFDPYKAEMLQGDGWRGLQVISLPLASGDRYVALFFRTLAIFRQTILVHSLLK